MTHATLDFSTVNPDIEYIIVDDVVPEPDEGNVPEQTTHWADSIQWSNHAAWADSPKTPKVAKNLKELLGEPDWEI